MTSTVPPDPSAQSQAPSDRLWLRSELMGTQVITRDSGRRLGVVGEVVVDIDRREVVALGLRDNPLTRFLPGLPRWMPLDRIRQVGDVILVDSADSLAEGFDPERYSKVINSQVVTESGVQLGRVLGFSFDIETGELTTLVIGAIGVPLLGEGVLSTWELPVGEIVSSGSDRIVVYEGAEEKLRQLGTGLLEKLGIGGSGWEQEERDRFRSNLVPAENQLPAGEVSQQEQRRLQPAASRAFEPRSELEYVELEERRDREPLRQRRYLDEDQDERSGRSRQEDWERSGREAGPEGRWREGEPERPPRRREAWEEEEERPARPPARGERYGEEARWREPDTDSYAPSRTPRDPEAGREDTWESERRPESWPPQSAPSRWRDEDPADPWGPPSDAPARADDGSAGGSRRERPAPQERPFSRRPEGGMQQEAAEGRRAPEPAEGSGRRPLGAEPRPNRPRSGGDSEPIDVDPEVLDDPW